jgi:hypothetical protein
VELADPAASPAATGAALLAEAESIDRGGTPSAPPSGGSAADRWRGKLRKQ